MRKVIQISAIQRTEQTATHTYPACLFALCNDGTMWSRQFVHDDVTKNVTKISIVVFAPT